MNPRTFAIIASLSVALAAPESVHAKSFMAFLRSVGNSIAHPQHHTKPASASHSKHSAEHAKENASANHGPTQQSSAPVTDTDSAMTATPAPPSPSVAPEPTIRSASLPAATTRRDIPYGVPVPNKAGFVTSPYAPRAGLVDVRGFPSGTEVKDPYSGKTFLAP